MILAPGGIWSIDPSNTMRWNGEPYVPFGVRIQPLAEDIENARKRGFTDVLVELPASGEGWTEAFQRLEASQLRYMVTLNSLAPRVPGYVVSPSGYRIPKIDGIRSVNFAMPNASTAFVALVSMRDSSILSTQRVPISSGLFRHTFDPQGLTDNLALLYPRLNDGTIPDYWEGFDRQRDGLLKAFKNSKPGAGFRGLVNPLGQVVRFPDSTANFVPDSPLFRTELAALLRRKYTGVTTACRVWNLAAPDFDSFEVMARLVPLWSGNRGVGKVWDPVTDKLYDADLRRSQAWRDIQEMILGTATQRTERLFRSLAKEIGAPVFQDYAGASGPYALARGAVSGVGVAMRGETLASLLEPAYSAAGAVMARQDSTGFLVTDLGVSTTGEGAQNISRLVNDLAGIGARGFFLSSADPGLQQAFLDATARLRAGTGWAASRTAPVFFPSEARNPANAMTLTGGRWWLPLAGAGARVELGADYGAYKLVRGPETAFVMWRSAGSARVRLKVPPGTVLAASAVDGSPVDLKLTKSGPELTMGNVPVIFTGSAECPIPLDAQESVLRQIGAFIALRSSVIPNIDAEAINLKSNVDAFNSAPGATHAAIQAMMQRMNQATADYVWIEAERCTNHTWSEAANDPSASGEGVLRLASRIPSDIAPLDATFGFIPKVAGPQTLWIAARIAESDRSRFVLRIGDKTFRLESPPVSAYGLGFAWYRVGDFGAERSPQELTISVDAPQAIDAALDVVVIAPGPFRPDGLRAPVQIPTVPAKGAAGAAGSEALPARTP